MRLRPPVRPEFTSLRAHRAERRRIRRDLRSRDRCRRDRAAVDLHLWAYKDAQLRDDNESAEAAWQALHQLLAARAAGGGRFDWYVSADFIRLAAGFDDVDRAAQHLGEWRRHVDTSVFGTDNQERTSARTFISACIQVLRREASIGHSHERGVPGGAAARAAGGRGAASGR